MKIYRLITVERITGIYSWTRKKYIVLMGNCIGSAAEQNFGGNENLVYTVFKINFAPFPVHFDCTCL